MFPGFKLARPTTLTLRRQLFTIRDQRVVTLGYVAVRGGIVDVCVEGYNNILVSTYVKLRSYRIDPSEDAEDNVFKCVCHPIQSRLAR